MNRSTAFAVVVGCASLPLLGQTSLSSSPGMIRPPVYYTLHGSCETVIRPDLAVIAGGVTGGGLKPTDAVLELEKELKVISSYVQSQQGSLVVMERIRTLKAPAQGNNANEQPAEVIQHIHVELPPDAPVDAILDRLLEMGMDRFGDSNLVSRSRQRAVALQFRVSNLRSLLLELRQSCLEDAWKAQCASDNPPRACAGDKIPATINYQTFHVRSVERILRANGAADFLRFSYSNDLLQNWDPPELLGNEPVKLIGEISAQYVEELKP